MAFQEFFVSHVCFVQIQRPVRGSVLPSYLSLSDTHVTLKRLRFMTARCHVVCASRDAFCFCAPVLENFSDAFHVSLQCQHDGISSY